jgi:CheY-like chemotaxis protein
MDESDNSGDMSFSASPFKKVLVVDDILYVVKSISKILQDEGYFVVTATTGKEAMFKCKQFAPNLVTIDQRLPDMTGLQLAEKISALAGIRRPKIVFISSVYDKEEIREIMSHKIDDYLLKPFKKAKLVETVMRLIGKARA